MAKFVFDFLDIWNEFYCTPAQSTTTVLSRNAQRRLKLMTIAYLAKSGHFVHLKKKMLKPSKVTF